MGQDQKKLFSTDRILSISAIVVALCAVFVSIWQGLVTREHNRKSLLPYITSSQVISGKEGESGIYISNGGVGPAFIKSAEIEANGKSFDLSVYSWPGIYEHLGIQGKCFREAFFKTGSVILSRDHVQLLAITTPSASDFCRKEFLKILATPEFNITIEYESAYKESFIYTRRIGK
ncbi:hypothetical protein [Vibrio diabolicus]|uniref:hypothetical protein n=1 Tax=Vibrio diabolicus TaxID=50719 RepID=UPI00375117D0